MQIDSSAFITDPSLVRVFQNKAVSLPCDRDRVLFFEGEPPTGLYILSRGSATLSWTGPDGQFDVTLQTTTPSLLGLPSLMEGEHHMYSVIAHSGAKIGFVSLYNFALMIEFDQFLALRSLQAVNAKTRSTQRAIFDQLDTGARNAA